jgi:hypothetical protein
MSRKASGTRKGRTDPLSAYRAEIRAIEDEFFDRPRPDGRVIGESVWLQGGDARDLLARIDEQYGVTPDDPRVGSIAAYKADLADLEDQFREALRGSSGDGRNESIRHAARLADCNARHFPRLFGRVRLDPNRIASRAEMWFYIKWQIDLYGKWKADAPELDPNVAVREAYSALPRLGLADWVPRPPWKDLTPQEAVGELALFANRLERMEQESQPPAEAQVSDEKRAGVLTPGSKAVAAALDLKKEGKPVSLNAACKRAGVDRKHVREKYPTYARAIKALATPDRSPPKAAWDGRTGRVEAIDEDDR